MVTVLVGEQRIGQKLRSQNPLLLANLIAHAMWFAMARRSGSAAALGSEHRRVSWRKQICGKRSDII